MFEFSFDSPLKRILFWRFFVITEIFILAGVIKLLIGIYGRITPASFIASILFLIIGTAINRIGWVVIMGSRWGAIIAAAYEKRKD
jgi:hypothetical protein